ncbi:nitroreductase family deazaflavin-dependent oxidoreductase [Amycolatopsis jiangsuensis]|uniref:Deazaflavin-dependent oxidoreductase (Nitroreductase family) n=1 Tax=Amycolatopsis jiangsuensis TaxID=1181879 RepID=A0A840IZ42_9PSEU|nr:nitroreductase family deazaflavin-dependent oxidoreductase [Amycolatopsis jiangsuensis]MBB4688121.1 deazaflavin-dependent oxidoreductase (nitroreductase family) [Amycolatopsis jiangsuensis]
MSDFDQQFNEEVRRHGGEEAAPVDFNQQIIDEFRANGGKVGGPFEGGKLLLLTHTGAKSGKQRVLPLAYTTDGDRLVIIASKAGADTNPDWYHNLRAHPRTTVEVGAEKFEVTARVVEDRAERDRLYAAMVAEMPGFADYEKKTSRVIPVIVLER